MGKQILFVVNGGLGKNIQATAIVKAIHDKYQDADIYVMASYPEAFANLDFIKKYFHSQPIPYLYDEIRDFEVIDVEPYRHREYGRGRIHLTEAWCKMMPSEFNIEPPMEKRGIIDLDMHEMNTALSIITRLNLPKDRPLIAFQFQGGTSYYNANDALDLSRIKHYRDLSVETAQKIVDELNKEGFIPVQISLPTEPALRDCVQLDRNNVINPRILFALLNQCSGLISIDSFAQHAWAALGKQKGVILWGGTNPTNLGYSSNVNIVSSRGKECKNLHCNRPDTFRYDIVGNGRLWTCKHNGKCMQFDPKEVVETLKGTMPQKPTNVMPMPQQ